MTERDKLRKFVKFEINSNGEAHRGPGTVKVTAKVSAHPFLERSRNVTNGSSVEDLQDACNTLLDSILEDLYRANKLLTIDLA